jgi:hypothetical protein
MTRAYASSTSSVELTTQASQPVSFISRSGLIRQMGLEGELPQAEVSMYESGRQITSLLVLREYARLAGLWIDALEQMR